MHPFPPGKALTPPARPLLPEEEGEGPNPPKDLHPLRPLLNFLPRKGAIPRQLHTFPPRKEAIHHWQVCPPGSFPGEGSNPSTGLPPAREGGNLPPKQVNLTTKIGPVGKALGALTGTGLPRLPRRTTLSPRKTTPPIPPARPPKDFQWRS